MKLARQFPRFQNAAVFVVILLLLYLYFNKYHRNVSRWIIRNGHMILNLAKDGLVFLGAFKNSCYWVFLDWVYAKEVNKSCAMQFQVVHAGCHHRLFIFWLFWPPLGSSDHLWHNPFPLLLVLLGAISWQHSWHCSALVELLLSLLSSPPQA